MTIPFFSIIIPCFNPKETIMRTIESIKNQDIDDFEVLICNDRSDDDFLSIIPDDYFSDLNIRVIDVDNEYHTPGNTRNFGIDNAIGEWLIFVDSDDFLCENILGTLKEKLLNTDCETIYMSPHNLLNEKLEKYGENPYINYLHGNAYNHHFIDKYDIRFNPTLKAHEDGAFNDNISFNAEIRNKKGYVIDDSIRVGNWVSNPDSITHAKFFQEKYFKYYIDKINLWLDYFDKYADFQDKISNRIISEFIFCLHLYNGMLYKNEMIKEDEERKDDADEYESIVKENFNYLLNKYCQIKIKTRISKDDFIKAINIHDYKDIKRSFYTQFIDKYIEYKSIPGLIEMLEDEIVEVIYLATENYTKYDKFFFDTLNLFLPDKKKIVRYLTNKNLDIKNYQKYIKKNIKDIKIMHCYDLPYPLIPLSKTFILKEMLENEHISDNIFYFDADTIFISKDKIYWKEFLTPLKNNYIYLTKCGYYAFEENDKNTIRSKKWINDIKSRNMTNPYSQTYIENDNYTYITSSFLGGNFDSLIKLCDMINDMIQKDMLHNDKDYRNYYIPYLYDENYFNKLVYNYEFKNDLTILFNIRQFMTFNFIMNDVKSSFMKQKFFNENNKNKKSGMNF